MGGVACQAADSRLHCAGGRVNVGLDGGGVLVRHDVFLYLLVGLCVKVV